MFPKCFKCSNNLSLSWFFCAFIGTKHRCVNCGALHEFTTRHRVSGALMVIAILFIAPLFDSIIEFYGLRILLVCAVFIPVISIIAGQHRLSPKDDSDAK